MSREFSYPGSEASKECRDPQSSEDQDYLAREGKSWDQLHNSFLNTGQKTNKAMTQKYQRIQKRLTRFRYPLPDVFLLIFGGFDVELKIRRMLVPPSRGTGDASGSRGDGARSGRYASGIAVADHRRFRSVHCEGRLTKISLG